MKKKIAFTKYICVDCGHHFRRKGGSAWHKCPKCGGDGWWEGSSLHSRPWERGNKRFRPMTPWEQRKIKFIRDNKKWVDDIRSRRVLPTGDVAVVDHKGNVKEVRTKDGRIIE